MQGSPSHQPTNGHGYRQWQQNAWSEYATSYAPNFEDGSNGNQSTIITMMENMRIQQQELYEEDR